MNVYVNINTFERLEIHIDELYKWNLQCYKNEIVIHQHNPNFMEPTKDIHISVQELYKDFKRRYSGTP